MRRTRPGGNPALYDSLYTVLQDLAKARQQTPEIRRQALVVLTDGADNASHLAFDDVLGLARRVGVGVYVISPKPARTPGMAVTDPEYWSRIQYSMNALVRDAGGRIFFPAAARDLQGVYGTIATELSTQYEIGYTPLHRTGGSAFRRISVQVVSRADVLARTRSGYISDTASTGSAPQR